MFKKLKNKTQECIKHIKTMFYTFLCARLRKGYGYYYYLCFKDFIKKLLKPKKMIAVKWRGKFDSEFKYFTYVDESKIKKSSKLLPNGKYNDNNIVAFLVQNNDTSIRQDELELVPQINYIIIENGYIFYNDNKMNSILYYGNPTKIKTNNNEWKNFNLTNLINDNTLSYLDIEHSIFLFEENIQRPQRWGFVEKNDFNTLTEREYLDFINEMSNPLLIIK